MNRRSLLTAAGALSLTQALALGGCTTTANGGPKVRSGAHSRSANSTRWHVSPAVGLDACFALTIAGADLSVLQAKHHQHRRAALRAMLGPDGVAAAERLMQGIAASGRKATPGAGLALVASAGGIKTLGQVIDSFTTDGILEDGLAGSGEFQSDRAKEGIKRVRPIAAAAFEALARSGFEKYWSNEYKPKLDAASSSLAVELSDIDMIAQHRRYLARALDDNITIFLSELSEPHGMRIIGQRFVTSPNYSTLISRRNAAHEIIHRLLENDRPETGRILARLSDDPLLLAIAEKADPAFGYTSQGAASVRGLVEEGGVQALEAVINEQLDQGRDQSEYWRHQDGGMHMFAAAVYERMNKTGFVEQGGDMLTWLDEQTAAGALQGASLENLAASIVGPEAVSRWLV